jgi:hypothetical protein
LSLAQFHDLRFDAHQTLLAGLEGLPEMAECFLSLKPDLPIEIGHSGTLLSAIIHGSENAPDRADAHRGQVVEVAIG